MTCKKIILFVAALAVGVLACEDPYNDKVDASKTDYVTNDNQHNPTELDTWLHNNFTVPYNIEVKYRWDASEADVLKTLTPPSPSKVQSVMDVVKKVWIDPYVAQAGETFIKQYCPKQFVLVGSANYNFDGTITLGTAEGGRKVLLYVVNDFEKTEQYSVKQLIHTVQHEFAHILHQNISYPAEFREITPGGYTAAWNTVPLGQARAQGFITSYAMSAPDEDFVEMISVMLLAGKEGYEAILDCETTAASRQLIKQKEQLVVEYLMDTYNIDFYSLQAQVQEAIEEIAPGDDGGEDPQPVFDIWGYGKPNTTLRFDLSVLNEPGGFVARYNYDNTVLHNQGFALDYNFKLFFSWENELTLRLYYYTLDSEPREYHEANFIFDLQKNSDGTVSLPYIGPDENGAFLEETGATALVAFFANNPSFTVDWEQTCAGERYVGFYPVKDPDNYCFGILTE